MSKDAQDAIAIGIAVSIFINALIFGIWYAATYPIKTTEQIREETYKMCIDRQTWSNKPLNGPANIEVCEPIKINPPK